VPRQAIFDGPKNSSHFNQGLNLLAGAADSYDWSLPANHTMPHATDAVPLSQLSCGHRVPETATRTNFTELFYGTGAIATSVSSPPSLSSGAPTRGGLARWYLEPCPSGRRGYPIGSRSEAEAWLFGSWAPRAGARLFDRFLGLMEISLLDTLSTLRNVRAFKDSRRGVSSRSTRSRLLCSRTLDRYRVSAFTDAGSAI
jgi:hypothetical protein